MPFALESTPDVGKLRRREFLQEWHERVSPKNWHAAQDFINGAMIMVKVHNDTELCLCTLCTALTCPRSPLVCVLRLLRRCLAMLQAFS